MAGAQFGSHDHPEDRLGLRAPGNTPGYVYIVDDDSMVRRSLSFFLQTAGFNVRSFICGRDFLEESSRLAPGCVLLDIRMPGMDGIAVLAALDKDVRRFGIIMLTGHADVEIAVRAMKRGALDLLEKPVSDANLLEVISIAFARLPVQVASHAQRTDAANKMRTLTFREGQVLDGLVAGLSNKDLARALQISVRTVEMHRSRLMSRLEVKSIGEAVRIALLGAVQPS